MNYDLDKIVPIRTHDRITHRRCKRKWFFSSPTRMNLAPKDGSTRSYLWAGEGFHFVMEDYHGYRFFDEPFKVFEAYMDCFKDLDSECLAFADICEGMLKHYTQRWLPRRREYETLWINRVPQVEIEFGVYIKELSEWLGVPVYYQGKFDRMVTDCDGKLWVMEYKTAAQFDVQKLETDPQINAYMWAAQLVYRRPVEGILYIQFKKAVPEEPRILVNGEISCNSKQRTTYGMYMRALTDKYGNPNKFPERNRAFLDFLSGSDTPEGDPFIRCDPVRRNKFAIAQEHSKIILEGRDMLNPQLTIDKCYPNPTRDCYWDCAYRDVCLAMDDGSDYKWILGNELHKKEVN